MMMSFIIVLRLICAPVLSAGWMNLWHSDALNGSEQLHGFIMSPQLRGTKDGRARQVNGGALQPINTERGPLRTLLCLLCLVVGPCSTILDPSSRVLDPSSTVRAVRGRPTREHWPTTMTLYLTDVSWVGHAC